ncbi:MAG: MarR family EPS-associated transcriptional regulator [Marinagarivorans sp.]|nr:MarR family EPS-associated transcriptional regulator [Marinagarivorans sp.]
MLDDEYRYKILKELQQDPNMSQRALAKRLEISLGKTNYCLNALIEKGMIKADNFKNSTNKMGYLYLLTPKGIEEKIALTQRFLQRKLKEHETLEKEIEQLRQEVKKHNVTLVGRMSREAGYVGRPLGKSDEPRQEIQHYEQVVPVKSDEPKSVM